MVCDGPDPPENDPQELSFPPRHELVNGIQQEDSDDEQNDHFGYEPLPQSIEAAQTQLDDDDSEDEAEINQEQLPADVPNIEPMGSVLIREVWSRPRITDPIVMDNERAQQVMTAMANFALPQTSIPEWAQTLSEEQWKATLNDKIEIMKKKT